MPRRNGQNPPLTDGELDHIKDAPALSATGGVELVPLPLGSRQRLVAEVQRWRELSRRLVSYPAGLARVSIPCPVCQRDYQRVRALPTPIEKRVERQASYAVEYVHEDGERCLQIEDLSPPTSQPSAD